MQAVAEQSIRLNIGALIAHLPRKPGVYVIRNVLTGKCYVGSSENIRRRAWYHINHLRRQKHHNAHLQNAWNLYGDDVFAFLTACLCDVDELLEREREWMQRLNSCSDRDGYNLVSDPVRHKVSTETRKKMSDSSPFKGKPAFNRGRPASEQTRRLISKAMVGRPTSAATRQRLSAAMLGPSHPHRGKRMTQKARENMSLSRHRMGPKRGRYKGVHLDARTKTYMARIYVAGSYRFLGRYVSEDDAARAYNNAATQHWGNDCYLNPVSSGVPVRYREIGRRLIHAS